MTVDALALLIPRMDTPLRLEHIVEEQPYYRLIALIALIALQRYQYM